MFLIYKCFVSQSRSEGVHLVQLGMLAFKNNPQLIERVKAVEARVERLETKLFLTLKKD